MEFGLVLSQFTDRFSHMEGDARAAEEHGLDSVWLVDHLLGIMDVDAPVFEAWTGLSYIAGITERVRLGHLVNCASFRNPGLLAKMAVTLDHASAGRLDLGLGAGWYEAEYEALGYPFGTAGDRRRYFAAYLEAVVRLLDGETVTMDRDGVVLKDAALYPDPIQTPHPPIMVGAGKPMMLALTGTFADIWNCPARGLPNLEELAAVVQESAGERSVRISIQVPVAVGRDQEEADLARSVGETHLNWLGGLDPHGISGTIDQALDQLRGYAARGVTDIVAIVPGSRARGAFIEAYAELAKAYRAL